AATENASDTAVSVASYPTGMGSSKASIPIKCMDHTPTPIDKAPPHHHHLKSGRGEACIRAAMARAVYDARTATIKEIVTSEKLYWVGSMKKQARRCRGVGEREGSGRDTWCSTERRALVVYCVSIVD